MFQLGIIAFTSMLSCTSIQVKRRYRNTMEKFSVWKDILWSGDDGGFHYTTRSPKLITYLNLQAPHSPPHSRWCCMVLLGVRKTTLAKDLMLDWALD